MEAKLKQKLELLGYINKNILFKINYYEKSVLDFKRSNKKKFSMMYTCFRIIIFFPEHFLGGKSSQSVSCSTCKDGISRLSGTLKRLYLNFRVDSSIFSL